MNIFECIDLYEKDILDISLITQNTGQNIRDCQFRHEVYDARMQSYKNNFSWDGIRLPEKHVIENWEYPTAIIKLMNQKYWTQKMAQQWLTDFMRWLYTSMRLIYEGRANYTTPMISISLDAAFHAYLEETVDYSNMCSELFGIDFIPHTPGPRTFTNNEQLQSFISVLRTEFKELEQDWGYEYITRVFEYETDTVAASLGRAVTINECLELCANKAFDYKLFGAAKGQIVKTSTAQQQLQNKRLDAFRKKIPQPDLPNKLAIENWQHLPTVLKLMNERTWTEEHAQQSLNDYMKWLYSAMHLSRITGRYSMPLLPFTLNYVWREYVQFYFDYSYMSETLFNINYIHNIPEVYDQSNPEQKANYINFLRHGLDILKSDWGSEYVNRIFTYETSIVKLRGLFTNNL